MYTFIIINEYHALLFHLIPFSVFHSDLSIYTGLAQSLSNWAPIPTRLTFHAHFHPLHNVQTTQVVVLCHKSNLLYHPPAENFSALPYYPGDKTQTPEHGI